jgi:two-component system LytT family response regulator
MKPVDQQRLTPSLQRARWQEIAGIAIRAPIGKVVGRSGKELFLLSIDEVMAFQADGNLVWIIMEKRRYWASTTLNEIDKRLAGTSFCRVHRNVLVNLNHVHKMATLSSQRWLLTMKNGAEFIMSKRRAWRVRGLLFGPAPI